MRNKIQSQMTSCRRVSWLWLLETYSFSDRQTTVETSIRLVYFLLISTFPKTSMKEEALRTLSTLPLPHSILYPSKPDFHSLNVFIFFLISQSIHFHHQLSAHPHQQTRPWQSLWSFTQLLCGCLWFSRDMFGPCVLQLCKVTGCFFPISSLFRTHGVAQGEVWALN